MKILILILIITLAGLSGVISAQEREKEIPFHCDAMLSIFDNVALAANSDNEKNSFLIVVAYAGDGEQKRIHTQRRLAGLAFYLTKYRGISVERLILTEGKARKGLGKIEFYLSGKLADEVFLMKRARVCTSCCPSEYLTRKYQPQ